MMKKTGYRKVSDGVVAEQAFGWFGNAFLLASW
jgi:hypothetical protein